MANVKPQLARRHRGIKKNPVVSPTHAFSAVSAVHIPWIIGGGLAVVLRWGTLSSHANGLSLCRQHTLVGPAKFQVFSSSIMDSN